ncbi:hypothetical protein TSAR_005907 [Trichomalopsis sarcophagae]|uniref:Uncharacterized protein n=1 Tax=Trichomalopsis sarcophagae TaxID=543379 RepID=A0A232EPJ2_9HYME|nr:hypothetical protein TSAR_005907 [Trichomalopsis sarcophagae]
MWLSKLRRVLDRARSALSDDVPHMVVRIMFSRGHNYRGN